MPDAHGAVVIACPPEEVFDFLADGCNSLRWRPAVVIVSEISGAGLGAVWRQVVRGPGGLLADADYQVTEFERPAQLQFRAISGPARPEVHFQLEPVEGGTQVTLDLHWEAHGVGLLIVPPVQTAMDAEVAQLPELKRVLEAS